MKFIRLETTANAEKRNEITKRIANGEIKLSHFAIDNDNFYHYYEILKTKK
jgi:hypothetical protein